MSNIRLGEPAPIRHAFPFTAITLMNYQILIQLKDAGFPMVTFTPQEGMEHRATDWAVGDGSVIQHPTLSELIEACVLFQRLSYDADHDEWHAEGSAFTGDGNSPEEAVANLWLQLNRHAP